MKVFSTKNDQTLDKIEATEEKINDIQSKQITEDLLKKCQWLYPIKDKSKEARVMAQVENARRLKECYIINNTKREYLESLRQQNNGR